MEYQQTPPPVPEVEYNYDIPERPKSWLLASILATLFCCLPLGLVGLINAIRVNSLYDQMRYEKAKRASANAKTWTVIAFCIGLLFIGSIFLISRLGSYSVMNMPNIGGEPLYF